MPGVVPYGPKTIRKYKGSQVAMHRVGMEDGWRDRPILRRLPISNKKVYPSRRDLDHARGAREKRLSCRAQLQIDSNMIDGIKRVPRSMCLPVCVF